MRSAMATVGICVSALLLAGSALAQPAETPRRGGTLNYMIKGAPPTLDCHGASGTPILEVVSPHYSRLLRFDQDKYPAVVGDLAESWTVSEDGLTYTFKIRPNVKFHDGSPLGAADIKASYDRLRDPPAGVVSIRKGNFITIKSIEVADPLTVVFRLTTENPAMLLIFASPYNCIYSAAKLAENPKYPDQSVMGSGPFVAVEYVSGGHMQSKRFDGYFRPGMPYLDGLKSFFLTGAGSINAIIGGQVDASFGLVSPTERARIQSSRADMEFPEGPFNALTMLSFNTTKAPFNDVRVRRAINLALDRRTGAAMISRLTYQRGFVGLLPLGAELQVPDEQLHTLPGYGANIAANRAEARRLLAEAGVPNLSFTLLNRNTGEPYPSLGIFLLDQFRQVGIKVEQVMAETGAFVTGLTSKTFDVAIDTNNTITADPTEALAKFLPSSTNNYGGFVDPVLEDLYAKQMIERDPAKRRQIVFEFQQRVLDQAYVAPLFGNANIAAVAKHIKGWKILPSTTMNKEFEQVWLQK